MFYNGIDKRIDVLCNRIGYRRSLMGYHEYVEGFKFGWLSAKLGKNKGEEFAAWCDQHDKQPETQAKIEWLQAHLSAKDRARFNELVTELHEWEQKYKDELEQELTLNYEDLKDKIEMPIINKSVPQKYVNICLVALITLAILTLCNQFTIGEL